MFLSDDNVPALMGWLEIELEPISLADPSTLAQYILTQLKKDMENHDLKVYCKEQLLDFLKEHTNQFVDDLFRVLEDESYLSLNLSTDERENYDDNGDVDYQTRSDQEEEDHHRAEEVSDLRDYSYHQHRNQSNEVHVTHEMTSRKRDSSSGGRHKQDHRKRSKSDMNEDLRVGLNKGNSTIDYRATHQMSMGQHMQYPPSTYPPLYMDLRVTSTGPNTTMYPPPSYPPNAPMTYPPPRGDEYIPSAESPPMPPSYPSTDGYYSGGGGSNMHMMSSHETYSMYSTPPPLPTYAPPPSQYDNEDKNMKLTGGPVPVVAPHPPYYGPSSSSPSMSCSHGVPPVPPLPGRTRESSSDFTSSTQMKPIPPPSYLSISTSYESSSSTTTTATTPGATSGVSSTPPPPAPQSSWIPPVYPPQSTYYTESLNSSNVNTTNNYNYLGAYSTATYTSNMSTADMYASTMTPPTSMSTTTGLNKSSNQSSSGGGSSGDYKKPHRRPHMQPPKNELAENERCTLLCTGIPPYLKEDDLLAHFRTFGRVVQLQLNVTDPGSTSASGSADNGTTGMEKDKEKKVYNECLIQYDNAENAKKCFHSPTAVLNNRFIRIQQSTFNIIPLADVPPPTQEELMELEAIKQQQKLQKQQGNTLAGSTVVTTSVSGTTATSSIPLSSPRSKQFPRPIPGKPIKNKKYIAGVTDVTQASQPTTTTSTSSQGGIVSTVTADAITIDTMSSISIQQTNENDSSGQTLSIDTSTITTTNPGPTDTTTATTTSLSPLLPKPTIQPSPTNVISTGPKKEDIALQQQYDDLRKLRTQVDSIWKKKCDLLQAQIDKIKEMLSKLENAPDDVSKHNTIENLEAKLVDLQSQLRIVQEQRTTGTLQNKANISTLSSPITKPIVYEYGGRGGRGRGRIPRGGPVPYGGRNFGGRLGGRWRPADTKSTHNFAIDNRPKTILIPSSEWLKLPENFMSDVPTIYAKFGEVIKMSSLPNGDLTIEYNTRREAEMAKNNGAVYENTPIKLEWYLQPSSSSNTATNSNYGSNSNSSIPMTNTSSSSSSGMSTAADSLVSYTGGGSSSGHIDDQLPHYDSMMME